MVVGSKCAASMTTCEVDADSSVVAPPYPASKSKSTVYQGGIRVPLLVAGAGVAVGCAIALAGTLATRLASRPAGGG